MIDYIIGHMSSIIYGSQLVGRTDILTLSIYGP